MARIAPRLRTAAAAVLALSAASWAVAQSNTVAAQPASKPPAVARPAGSAVLADQLNQMLDTALAQAAQLFKRPGQGQTPWWERPLADRLSQGLDRMEGVMSRLEPRDIARAADTLGLAGPVWSPAPVLPREQAKLPDSAALTLLEAWRAAVANDRTLRAARAAAQSAQERLPQARAQALPALQYSASQFGNIVAREGLNTLSQPLQTFDRYDSSTQTLSVRQPLIRAALPHLLTQAKWVGEEAQAVLRRETQSLAVKVAASYLEALLAQDQLALVQAQQRFLKTVVAAETRALAAGTGTRTAVDEAQARFDLNLAQELEARQAVDLSRRQLEALVNQPIGKLAVMDTSNLNLGALVQGSLDDWIAQSLRSSPEVQAVQAQIEQLRQEIGKARAGHLPTVDLVAQAQRSRSDNIISPQSRYVSQSIGLQLNVPLYNGGYVNSQTRQASAEAERAREQLEALRLDLAVRVHREYRAVTEGALRIRGLEVAARSARVALDSARKSMAAGVRTTVDVLNAEQQLVQVERDLAQARYLAVASTVRLQALAGAVDEDIMTRTSAAFKP